MPSTKEKIRRNIEKGDKLRNPETIEFKSTHGLDFLVAPHFMPEFANFKVGTCHGLYTADADKYIIVAVVNDKNGNGHLQDVFDWFEQSCIRDNKKLMVAELMNGSFRKHLIEKRGFVPYGENDLIKEFK